jgi:hypothetical protein
MAKQNVKRIGKQNDTVEFAGDNYSTLPHTCAISDHCAAVPSGLDFFQIRRKDPDYGNGQSVDATVQGAQVGA